jgi:hypothetical protein
MADYIGVLNDLRGRRAALRKELEELDTAIGALERLAGANRNGHQPATVSSRAAVAAVPSLRGLTLANAVVAYMTAIGQPQTTRQVVEGLKAAGVNASAPSFDTQVYNALNRMTGESGQVSREGGLWLLKPKDEGLLGSYAGGA